MSPNELILLYLCNSAALPWVAPKLFE